MSVGSTWRTYSERHQREQEVDDRDNHARGSWMVKPESSKDAGGEVHQAVESAQLLQRLEPARDYWWSVIVEVASRKNQGPLT
jgi:hypothetical protein